MSVKLNSADFQRGGFSEDESRDVIAALAGEGLDLIEISGGNYESPAMSGSAASTRVREAYFLDYARTVRRLAGDVPLAVTGGFRSHAAIHDALRAGDCDVVGLARPTVTTPDAAAAILSERIEVLQTRELRYGMRRVLGRFVDVKALDGVLEHQLEHRPTASPGRRPRTGPQPGTAGHHGGHAPSQRHGLLAPQAGHPMTRQSYDVAGKVVLITGGTGGIGRATARELLRRGAKVAIVDVDPDTPGIAERLSSHSAIGVISDVRLRSTLDSAVADIVDRFGRIDVAIANAGILSRAATLRTTPAPSIESVLAVNITGVLNTVQAAMDQVIAHRGQFVLISSVFAFLNGMGTIPYAMSKAAVEQLGRGLRVELAAHGVSTTVAYFSLIDTDMIKHGVDDDPVVDELLAALPKPLLKRLQPDAAATALADALTHRSPRVMAPARWQPISALRGIVAPALDPRLARNPRTRAALAELDARTPTAP